MTTFAAWPQNYKSKEAVSTFLFGDVSSWTTNRCTVEAVTSVTRSGSSTLKVTCTSAGTLQVYKTNISSPPTFSTGLITFRVRQDVENVSANLQLILSNDTGGFTNCRYYSANQNAVKVGWNSLVFDLTAPSTNLPTGYTYTNQGAGYDYKSAAASIQFAVPNAAVGDVFYLDAIANGRRSRPKVIFGFDSYSNTVFAQGYPLLTARGLKGYFAVSPLGNPSANYGTTQIANLRTAMNAGWDIINHSYSHSDMTLMDAAAVAYEVTENARILNGYGVLNRPQYFMYPGNKCNEFVQSILGTLGIVAGREVRNWRVCTDDEGLGVPRRTGAFPLGGQTLTQAKAAIDNAIRCGTTLNMYSHEIIAGGDGTTPPVDPLDWYANDLASLLDYALSLRAMGLIDIPSWHEWYVGLAQPQAVA